MNYHEVSTSYVAPPKLYKQFMLAGLTVPEIGIILVLFFSQLLTRNYLYSFFLPVTFIVFVARLFEEKSLKDVLLVLLRYHTRPQQFTMHCAPAIVKKKERKSNR